MTNTTLQIAETDRLVAEPLLKVEGLTTTFRVGAVNVKAVNDLSFDLRPGRVLGIVGESGSGKSVTARSVMGMLRPPGRVEAGRVLFGGVDLLGLTERQMEAVRGKQIAMVFQDPQAALNPAMRVGDQIAEALLVHGADRRTARSRALELLRQVGIPEVDRAIDRFPHEFSGGMRQRVVIAIALANNPSLLIADEPTTALDVTIQAQILRLLVELRSQLGISIVLITHDMGVVADLCDDLLVMYAGRAVERGPIEEVFERPLHPYTAALLRAVPTLETEEDEVLSAIPGAPPALSRLPSGCAFHPRCAFAIDRCVRETPPEFELAPGHRSACWVAAEGQPVEPPPAPRRQHHDVADSHGAPILKVQDLRTNVASRRAGLFSRVDPIYAVDGVSLEIHAAETVGLVGESGCGKSTLSRTIMGINEVASGRILVNGRDVAALAPEERRAAMTSIQYVFQDPFSSLNPRRTIGQSLEEALGVVGIKAHQEVHRRSVELLERVGMSADHLTRYPYELSGGQRQRVGVARALAAEPKILICDEPVSALDVSIQAQIINLLAELQDRLGLGYLFIAHDLSVVRHISDRVAVMYLGRIVEIGTSRQVYGSPQHPYTVSLLSSTPEPRINRSPRKRVILSGDMPSPAHPPSGCRFRTRCPIGPIHFPDRKICETTAPELKPTARGQAAACHFAGTLEP